MRRASFTVPLESMSRFAMLFPGQGAQSIGMLSSLGEKHPVIGDTFAEAGDVLGFDVADLIANGPAETLDQTEYTQPALVAASVAVWRAWEAAGGKRPVAVAGHSLGEYSALVAAEVMDFPDALRLTRLRGQAMQNAVSAGDGAMAAVIGLTDDEVIAVCKQASEAGEGDVSAANFNAPSQVVIAGHAEACERAGRIAKENGAKLVKTLAVSVPSHCALMTPAAERLASHLADMPLREPVLAVYHNVDAQPRDDIESIRKALVAQLAESVHWADTIRRIHAENCDRFIECGPGKVLSGLNRRIDKSLKSFALSEPSDFDTALSTVAD